MGLCIGIKENQLRDAVEILGTDKFKYKFLYNTENHEEFHEKLNIKKLRDCVLFSGCTSHFRAGKQKVKGVEARTHWSQMINQIFLEDRHLAIVNDFYDNPYMVLVMTDKYADKSSQRNINMTFSDEQCDLMLEILLNNLEMQEGMPIATLDLYKSGLAKDIDENNENFKHRQQILKEKTERKYKEQLVKHFEESFKFRLITYYSKLREFSLDDIMRKLDDLGFLDDRFKNNDVYIYEEEARRLLARRLCTISFRNDIAILIKQGILDKDRIQYDIGI